MRVGVIPLVLNAILLSTSASAFEAYYSKGLFADPMFRAPPPAHDPENNPDDPRNCLGVEWNDKRALSVAKVTAGPRINLIKSRHDDMFKANTCPAATEACRKKSYLVPGDLVLIGKTQGNLTCVIYPSPLADWTSGWLPNSALKPVAPMPSPQMTDWIGAWEERYAGIEIKPGGIGGRLHIKGAAAFLGVGVIDAQVMPAKDTISFLEDGWLPFETQCDGGCRVRMQRIGPYLLVEDNGQCGSGSASFTGLYRRK